MINHKTAEQHDNLSNITNAIVALIYKLHINYAFIISIINKNGQTTLKPEMS